jgi:hypothetical protein
MTVPAHASPSLLADRHPADEQDYVLSGRPLRPGASLESTSRFHEDRWDLRAAILQKQGKALALDFVTVPARYQATAKELFYLLLAGPYPHGVAELSISTIRQKFSALASFWHWLDARPAGAARPAPAPAASDLEDYHRHLLATIRTRGPRVTRKAAIRLLWFYRHQLSHGLPFDPCHLEGWAEPHPDRPGENSTDRIPESVMGPLLAWSLRFVRDFAGDILAAVTEATPLHAAEHHTAGKFLDTRALQDLLAWHEAERRPLPGFRGKVNTTFLARKLGCHRASLARLADRISVTAAIVGIEDGTYLEARPAAELDGTAWLDRIDYSGKGHDSVGMLARMLQTSCYIVIAYLSGMRDSEIKHLRRGCLAIRRDPDGVAYRWKVTSLAFKGEDDPAGVTTTWSVGRPVAEAISVLERLQPDAEDLLFTRLALREGIRPRSANAAISAEQTRAALAAFVRWVSDYCARRHRYESVPPVGDAPWRFATRQFRRTLAWHIARRPGGVIAGALQYRHHAIQLFEGYSGTSESGFRAEVESEQAIARGEHLLALIDQHHHDQLTGPAADEAMRRLEELGEHQRLAGQVVTDPRRLERLMKRHDPAIYPGKYVTCVYNHAKALCGGSTQPDLSSCQPLRCRNVALTPGNRDSLTEEIASLDAALSARPALPPLLERRLRDRHQAIAGFLASHQLGPA